uniref:Uncharacterized protein n=1 Tax=Meloidogyne incognita TaxID=6306 RepID=A0A914NSG4_MELIC
MTEPVPSSRKLGKKPKLYFADDELGRLPSRKSMDSATELKYRREAAEFIQEMAEQLNHNIPQHRGHWQSCIHFNKTTNDVCIYLACRCADDEI